VNYQLRKTSQFCSLIDAEPGGFFRLPGKKITLNPLPPLENEKKTSEEMMNMESNSLDWQRNRLLNTAPLLGGNISDIEVY
jgi:hypothetical protein